MHLRRMSLLMAIIITLGLLPMFAIPAQAAYENTYENTGNQRADIIGVALTQVGYREGDGKSNNNKNKYSEYFGHGARAWCGDFVSWCARQANIPKSIIKTSGPANPSTFGITKTYKSGYTPKPGDLFFRSTEHVGIVYYTEGKYFYTIEGNTWTGSPRKDGVYIRKRVIADYTFGVPNYSSDAASANCDHSYKTEHESAHPHKEYKICTKCSVKTFTGNEVNVSDCKTCAQASCNHQYSDWSNSSSTKHKRTCSLCGKSESESHKWSKAETTKEATCNESGAKTQTCTSCGTEKTSTISATGKHKYEDIVYIDDEYHGKVCADCGNQDKTKHTLDKEWTSDGKAHWNVCSGCSSQVQYTIHEYENGCGSPCKTCGYLSPFDHDLTDSYTADDAKHYKTCSRCNLSVEPEDHTYTSECDEYCDICQHIRATSAPHADAPCADGKAHWIACSVCGQEQERTPHSPDDSVNDWEDQPCTQCGFILRSADEHVHTYQSIDYDRRTHWGVCICGADIPAEGHRFSMETGKCNICNAESSPIGAQYDYDWVWMVAVAAFAGIVLILLLILLIRSIFRRRSYEPVTPYK